MGKCRCRLNVPFPGQSITKQQRGKVRFQQLNRWYRALDALLVAKRRIEEALYVRVRGHRVSPKVDMAFYDVISTYSTNRLRTQLTNMS